MKVWNLILISGLLVTASFAHADGVPPYVLTCKVTQETQQNGQAVHDEIQTEKAALAAMSPSPKIPGYITYDAKLQFTVKPKVGPSFDVISEAALEPAFTLSGYPGTWPGKVYNELYATVAGVSIGVPVIDQSLADFESKGQSQNSVWFKVGDVSFYVNCTLE